MRYTAPPYPESAVQDVNDECVIVIVWEDVVRRQYTALPFPVDKERFVKEQEERESEVEVMGGVEGDMRMRGLV